MTQVIRMFALLCVWSISVLLFSFLHSIQYIIVSYSHPTVLWNTGTYYFYLTTFWCPFFLSLSPKYSNFPIITILSFNQLLNFFFQLPCIRENMEYLVFCACLSLLNVTVSRSVHFTVRIRVSLFFKS